jgi:hypothetical protein
MFDSVGRRMIPVNNLMGFCEAKKKTMSDTTMVKYLRIWKANVNIASPNVQFADVRFYAIPYLIRCYLQGRMICVMVDISTAQLYNTIGY